MRSVLASLALGCGLVVVAQGSAAASPVTSSSQGPQDVEVASSSTSSGRYRVGMQVKLNLLARTLTGAEAGHIRSIAYGPGQTGRIVGFVRRAAAGDPTEKLDLAVVRWDAQVWREAVVPLDGSPREITDELGAPVTLPAFEALANLVHLTPVRENELTSRGGDRVDTSQYAAMAQLMPSRVACGRATNPVAGQYLIVVRPFTSGVSVVDDYAHRPGVKLRRVGPRTGSFTADVAPAAFEILQRDLRVAEIWDLCR